MNVNHDKIIFVGAHGKETTSPLDQVVCRPMRKIGAYSDRHLPRNMKVERQSVP